jgi:hypothetical protein
MKRFRASMLLLFTGILIALVFFGSQMQVRTAFAFPGDAAFNPAAPTANTCAVSGCHTGTVSSTGAVIMFPSGVTSYKPGGPAIPLTIMVPGTTYQNWGFQIAARMANSATSPAGSFTPGDNGVTQGSSSSSTFNLNWTPPPVGTTGTVNFYLTGVNTSSRANNNIFSTVTSMLAGAAATPPPATDFSLSATPSSQTVVQGNSTTYTASVAAVNGFTGTVTLSASGLPAGATASFSPAMVTNSGNSTMTLKTASTTPIGSSTITITGTGTTGTPKTPTVTLIVKGATTPPTTPPPTTPPPTTPPPTTPPPTTPPPGRCDEDCGGNAATMYAQPYVKDPNSSGTLTALWVDLLGAPTGNQSSTGNPGLVLSKNATLHPTANASAPGGSQAGAIVTNVQGLSPLFELGFDYRDGGQCTDTSPRFVVVTSDTKTHVVGGCSKGKITAAPMMGWTRVRFDLTDAKVQSDPAIVPGDTVTSITLVLDQGPEAGSTAAGGLVVIDNIDVNGTFVGKGSSAPPNRSRRSD